MNFDRHLDSTLKGHFSKYKEILILLGSRQTGKTTLVKKIFPHAQYLLVDNEPVRRALETYDINTYKSILQPESGELIIDEIHLLSNPGRAAKIIFDQLPIKLIITGSSSFHIKNKTSESLAGRKIDYFLYPLTFSEYLFQNDIEKSLNHNIFDNITNRDNPQKKTYLFDCDEILNMVLLFGLYPNMLNHPGDTLYLNNFIDSLVFKDLLDLNLIDNRRAAVSLLKMLAYQTGNIINYSELADNIKIDQRTVKRYIEIFEQSFIVFRLYPFAKNRRDELIKSPKIYFFDTGVRNALINDFTDLSLRPDRGALFENFIISEVIKSNTCLNAGYNINFWRTKQKSEVDLLLSKGKQIIAAEIKYKGGSVNRAFRNSYPDALCRVINVENFY